MGITDIIKDFPAIFNMIKKYFSIKFFKSKPFIYGSADIINVCNLHCSHCYWWKTRRNESDELSIEEVSHKFALSQSYFSFLFKSITSKTFTEYLSKLRISIAMEFLRNTDKRVIDICCDVGFNNVNHFNRVFKQQTGISPISYRKSGSN